MTTPRFLIDTHGWIWWNAQPDRLPSKVIEIITDKQNEIVFSVVSAWEISIKYALGKLQLPIEPSEYVPSRLAVNQMTVLPVQLSHTLRVATLPHHHGDPFDRLLVATGQVEGLTLITADTKFEAYDIEIFW